MQVKIQKVRDDAQLPAYQTDGAAAVDLHACLDGPVTLQASKTAIIPTGVAIELPDGYEAQVRARSGLAAKHAIGLANGVGTIDSDYRGEISVILINWSDTDFVIEPGMRIAQLVVARYEKIEWQEAHEINTATMRGQGKFGSTGA
ncbi:MAG: dUTP diphosphatase [Candidatus Saccharimonadales bacterium]